MQQEKSINEQLKDYKNLIDTQKMDGNSWNYQKQQKSDKIDQLLESLGINLDDIDQFEIASRDDLIQLKNGFKHDQPIVMTNILEYAVEKLEQKLSYIIIVEYEIKITE